MALISFRVFALGLVLAVLTPLLFVSYRHGAYLYSNLRLIGHPSRYHGDMIRAGFFEGWYYKVVTADASAAVAIVPGVYKARAREPKKGEYEQSDDGANASKSGGTGGEGKEAEKVHEDKNGRSSDQKGSEITQNKEDVDNDSHAFVLVFTSNMRDALYYRYDLDSFVSEPGKGRGEFVVKIGMSRFTKDEVVLSLPREQLWMPDDEEHSAFIDQVRREWIALVGASEESAAANERESVKEESEPESGSGSSSLFPSPSPSPSPSIPLPAAYTSLNASSTLSWSVRGFVKFSQSTPFESTWLSPSVMGFFHYIPWLECYHSIVSMDHVVQGQIEFLNPRGATERSFELDQGRGYVEKDWGTNFPDAYIWLQCNNFEGDQGNSLMVSIADFPVIESVLHIPGSIIVFHHAQTNTTHTFGTYTLSRSHSLELSIDPAGGHLLQRMRLHVNNRFTGVNLEVNATRHVGSGVFLRMPRKMSGPMALGVEESLNAEVEVRLWLDGSPAQAEETTKDEGVTKGDGKKDPGQNVLFHAKGRSAGMEVVGDVRKLASRYTRLMGV